jgi:transcriptional regulator of acetoin/glycerol metabolism
VKYYLIEATTQVLYSGTAAEKAEELRRLRQLRDAYLDGRHDSPPVRPSVLNAWSRSRLAGVDPDKRQIDVFRRPRLEERLVRAALPVVRRLADAVSGCLAVVVLADGQGVLAHVEGDRAVRRLLERVQALPGADASEEASGSNAVGTAIEEGRGIQLCAAEHYIEGFHTFACTAIPIKDPITGRILAVLDVTSRAEDLCPAALELVREGAQQIMENLVQQLARRERALLDQYWQALKRSRRAGIIATNGETVIASREALKLVHSEDYPLLFLQAEEALRQGSTIERLVTLTDGRPVRLMAQPSYDGGEYVGTLLLLRSVGGTGRTASRPHRTPDPFDHLVGVSDPFRRMVETARQLLAEKGPVYIWGEAGSGKHALAQAMAVALGGGLQSVDCASLRPGQLRSQLRAWARAHTILLRHVDAASPRLGQALLDLLDRLGPQARVIATGLRRPFGAHKEGPLPRLLRRLAAFTIEVPPLRERREDIPLLAQAFLRCRGLNSYLSLEVAQALTRYDWPGNVAQLESVILSAAAAARGRDITLADLPPDIVHAYRAPRLSRWEEVELEALRQALLQTRGNRSRAAELLGISRVTIYRRLKQCQRLGIDLGLHV